MIEYGRIKIYNFLKDVIYDVHGFDILIISLISIFQSNPIIQRQREEPEVAAFVTIPKPEISTEIIRMSPEHVKHYKHWLDEFAAWFKEQLRLEKESPEGHKIDQMVVLAHLTQLQFASTIPQSKKTNNEHCLWPGGVTTKQAYSRILRPQQTRKPRIYLLRAKGTIDEYMQ